MNVETSLFIYILHISLKLCATISLLELLTMEIHGRLAMCKIKGKPGQKSIIFYMSFINAP